MLDIILAILLSFPVHHTDRTENGEARETRLREVAIAIDRASYRVKGPRKEIAAALLAIGWHESNFAGYVQRDQCLLGPPGAQCDRDPRTGQPRARSPWQLWRVAAPKGNETRNERVQG